MMLSGLLKSDIAVKINIEIIDAFVKMKRSFANNINNNQNNGQIITLYVIMKTKVFRSNYSLFG